MARRVVIVYRVEIEMLAEVTEGFSRHLLVPRVEGFFVWSLLDNWEWDLGFTSKFGLVAQNVNTGERTPKKSYAWFADIAETGMLPA